MKNNLKISFFLLFASFIMVSCDGLLSVDSDRYVMEEDFRMKSMNDSLYGMFGVFSQLQKVADEYVLLGELRGDLMTVTDKSNPDLLEINNFEISSENKYNDPKQYYAVINNCNYIIHYSDTTLTYKNEKVMYKVVAAAKAIRAWTYMQLALNYKTVKYYTNPILTIEDADKSYPVLEMGALADKLIEDITPYKDVQKLNYITDIYAINFKDCLFPINVLLGDLYLWKGDYEKAATNYYNYLIKEKKIVSTAFKSVIGVSGNVFNNITTVDWIDCFEKNTFENVASVGASNEYGPQFLTDSLAKDYQLTCTPFAFNNWKSQKYVVRESGVTLDTMLDLRLKSSIAADYQLIGSSSSLYSEPKLTTKNYLSKLIYMNRYSNISKKIMPYRVATVYLRYAEAVNRLGKPHLAFAALKYGLNPVTMANKTYVPTTEVPDTLQANQQYLNFKNSIFTSNIAIRARGLGSPEYDDTYVLPTNLTDAALIEYVEDLIINECALETAFEGNRFHDLMRVAIRRNDPMYLAKRVAAKYADPAGMEAILKKTENWYLKK